MSPTGPEMPLTLGAHQDQRDLARVPVAGHAAVVVINGLETDLILQAEDKHDGVHPHGELRRKRAGEQGRGGTRQREGAALGHLREHGQRGHAWRPASTETCF